MTIKAKHHILIVGGGRGPAIRLSRSPICHAAP